MFDVQTFNSVGDVVCRDTFQTETGVLKMARLAFQFGNGVSINGQECFTFFEAERALRNMVAETA